MDIQVQRPTAGDVPVREPFKCKGSNGVYMRMKLESDLPGFAVHYEDCYVPAVNLDNGKLRMFKVGHEVEPVTAVVRVLK